MFYERRRVIYRSCNLLRKWSHRGHLSWSSSAILREGERACESASSTTRTARFDDFSLSTLPDDKRFVRCITTYRINLHNQLDYAYTDPVIKRKSKRQSVFNFNTVSSSLAESNTPSPLFLFHSFGGGCVWGCEQKAKKKISASNQARAIRLRIDSITIVCVCVCVCVIHFRIT